MKLTVALWTTFLIFAALPIWADSNRVPSSSRSRRAVAALRPYLEADLAKKGFTWGAPVFVRIFKAKKILEVWLKSGKRYRRYAIYPICTYGGRGLGPKTVRGDRRAPEGFYFVGPDQMNPFSRYHLAFNLGYPNAYDRRHGRTGSALMVHGSCLSIGCFAMTNKAIEQIYTLADAALRNGQPFFRVHIFPFALENKNLRKHRGSAWFDFWKNLQAGYTWFEKCGCPPNVNVRNGRYVFSHLAKPADAVWPRGHPGPVHQSNSSS